MHKCDLSVHPPQPADLCHARKWLDIARESSSADVGKLVASSDRVTSARAVARYLIQNDRPWLPR